MCLALIPSASTQGSCFLMCLALMLSINARLLLSHVPCFDAQHQRKALAFSCALLWCSASTQGSCFLMCLCFVSASRCTAYHADSYSHDKLASSQVLNFLRVTYINLSQHPWRRSCSLLIVPSIYAYVYRVCVSCACALSANITPLFTVLRCLRVSRCSSSSSLYVPCFVWLSITMLSQVLHPQHHAAHVPCLVSAWHHAALQCSAFSPIYFPVGWRRN